MAQPEGEGPAKRAKAYTRTVQVAASRSSLAGAVAIRQSTRQHSSVQEVFDWYRQNRYERSFANQLKTDSKLRYHDRRGWSKDIVKHIFPAFAENKDDYRRFSRLVDSYSKSVKRKRAAAAKAVATEATAEATVTDAPPPTSAVPQVEVIDLDDFECTDQLEEEADEAWISSTKMTKKHYNQVLPDVLRTTIVDFAAAADRAGSGFTSEEFTSLIFQTLKLYSALPGVKLNHNERAVLQKGQAGTALRLTFKADTHKDFKFKRSSSMPQSRILASQEWVAEHYCTLLYETLKTHGFVGEDGRLRNTHLILNCDECGMLFAGKPSRKTVFCARGDGRSGRADVEVRDLPTQRVLCDTSCLG